MDIREMDVIRLNPHHITDIKELKINGENCTTLSQVSNMVYVSKDGSDSDGNGSFGNPFLTIEHANNYAIDNRPRWPGRIVVQVMPGIYSEHLTRGYYRVIIMGNVDPSEKNNVVTIRNTGEDSDHYIFGMAGSINLIGINIETTDVDNEAITGIYGPIQSGSTFSYCHFRNGYFVEQTDPSAGSVYMYMYRCFFSDGDGFRLSGDVGVYRYLNFVNCVLDEAVDMLLESTHTVVDSYHTIKMDGCYVTSKINIKGDWNCLVQKSEMYDAKLTFDTDGYVDIFSSILWGGVHFYSDTPQTKKLVNSIFKGTPTGEGDITADESIEFIEYSGNHQMNGIDGEVITVSKIKNVGGGQNAYRNIHEALKGSTLQDTIINLEGDVEVDIPLVIPPGITIQIDGNNKWILNSTATANLVELGANQHMSFVGMRKITGGKKAIINGNGASLAFIDCGNYLDACNVNIEINAGSISSSVHLLNSVIIGTGAPAITVNDVDPWLIIDKTFIKGASGEPAIEWSVDADSRFRGKYSTLLHGSGAGNSPFANTTSPTDDINFSLYNSSLNASYAANEFTNLISAQPSVSIDPDIDY